MIPAQRTKETDDTDALIALAQQSFTNAAEAADAENDRMGVPTHGATNGKLTIRHPPQKVESLDPE